MWTPALKKSKEPSARWDSIVNGKGSVNNTEEESLVTSSIVYGPVPSRRLGRSLGINNIPPKAAGGTGRACH
jgi:hypothetical protein